MSVREESSSAVPPPVSVSRPGTDASETHHTVTASDGTRLYLRRKIARDPANKLCVTPVFCDGILCDGFIWKYLWDELAAQCDVAHWHYRGHGRSGTPVDSARIDIAAHAADLATVRAELGDPPCVLVGHSMGTQVALEGWRVAPRNVKGLVLLCGSYGKVTQSFRGIPILDMILPKVMDIVDKQPEIARALWSRIPPELALRAALLARDIDPRNVRREDILPYLKHMTHVDFAMFLRMLRAAGDHTAEDWLAEVNIPVIIVAGERDTFTPASLSEAMAERIPNAELLMVKGGSHVAPIEQPELVSERIRAFLSRVAET
jgi:pimeloyl-ACP methyl ester carboxylesterase